MAKSIIDELVTLLGFEIDPKSHPTLTKFTDGVKSVASVASVAAASVTAMAASVLFFAEKSAGAGAEIERFHRLTGMSTDSIQQWAYAAEQVSGKKESILNDIEKLTTDLNPIMPGQFNQGMFLFFGEKLKTIKDANQALHEMAKIFPQLTPQKAMQWGQMMGISPETVMLLRQGEAGVKSMFDKSKGRILSPQETAEALKFAQLWSDIKNRAEKFTEHIGIALIPLLDKILTRATKWWDLHQKTMGEGFKKFVDAGGQALGILEKMVDHAEVFLGIWVGSKLMGGLASLISTFGILKEAILGVGIVAATVETGAAVGGAGAIAGGGILGMLARFLPAPLAGALAAAYVMKPTAVNDVDEVSKIRNFGGPAPNFKDMNSNMAYLEQSGTSPAILQALRDAQAGKTFNQTNNIQVTTPDAYSAGSEVTHRLERLQRTDFAVQSLAPVMN